MYYCVIVAFCQHVLNEHAMLWNNFARSNNWLGLHLSVYKDDDDEFFCKALNNIVNWCQGTWCKQSLAPFRHSGHQTFRALSLCIPGFRHSRPFPIFWSGDAPVYLFPLPVIRLHPVEIVTSLPLKLLNAGTMSHAELRVAYFAKKTIHIAPNNIILR